MRYDVKQYNTIIIQRTVKISQYNTTQTNTIQTYSAIQRQCWFKLENSEYTKKLSSALESTSPSSTIKTRCTFGSICMNQLGTAGGLEVLYFIS